MKIAVFGATGATGVHVVAQTLAQGHEVTVLVRDPARLAQGDAALRVVVGGLDQPETVDEVVRGQDVVISALGTNRRGPVSVCTDGIRAVLAAMGRHGVRRLLVVSAHGANETHDRSLYTSSVWTAMRHKMRDKEAMEALIRDADVDATIVRPPALSNGPRTGAYAASTTLPIAITSRVPRADVADFLLRAAMDGTFVGQAPSITATSRPDASGAANGLRRGSATVGSSAEPSMQGRVALVTGAAGGMGRVIATDLARRGAIVVLAVRNHEQGQTLQREIAVSTGNNRIEVLAADLSSQAEVRELAAEFRSRHDALHVLVNNAGAHFQDRRVSVDAVELHFAVNHLAWFLLTNLLSDVLRASAPARVVNVTSQSMADARRVTLLGPPQPVALALDDLQAENNFVAMQVYARAKLAMVMGGYRLARDLTGSGVTVNALHPGLVATGIIDAITPRLAKPVVGLVRKTLLTPEDGARTAIYLATSPEVEHVTGKYFINQAGHPSPPISYDTDLQDQLWTASARLTGLIAPPGLRHHQIGA